VVFYYKTLAMPNPPFLRLRLQGLNPQLKYKINNEESFFYGDELMKIGFTLPLIKEDFSSEIYYLNSVDSKEKSENF
jgi:alpha-galactosidase